MAWLSLAPWNAVQAAEAAVEQEAGANGDAEAADPFAIPEGDAKTLHRYITKLMSIEPQGETQEEQEEFRVKAVRTLVEASDRLLASKPNDSQAIDGARMRLMGLQALAFQVQDEGAADRLAKAIEEARGDQREAIAAAGWEAYLSSKIMDWGGLAPGERDEIGDEIIAKIKDSKGSGLDVAIVRMTASALEGQDDEFVKRLLAKTLPILSQSKNPKVKATLADANLAGMSRRINLLGNPMEVFGTFLDGKKVDWESYRGKVVLVDFWATWCGPCRGEVPNVLAMYQAYHDKGFEVVGVSLDKTPEDAKRYVAEMKIPWQSIFPTDENERGWDHPLARYYGIGGIPTAILVDQKGNVVHLEARGKNLRQQLKKLLGDPVEEKATENVAAGR